MKAQKAEENQEDNFGGGTPEVEKIQGEADVANATHIRQQTKAKMIKQANED